MKDSTNNKMSSEEISDLKVPIYDNNTAIATYTDTYDGMGPRRTSRQDCSQHRHVCPPEWRVERSRRP
jgi:hypothetical protein